MMATKSSSGSGTLTQSTTATTTVTDDELSSRPMNVDDDDDDMPDNDENERDVFQDEVDDETTSTTTAHANNDFPAEMSPPWSPSGSWWKDMLHFVGPGWFVSIAYVDPGNYQADIQAGATSRYNLLFVVWWTSILSIYVQILCVRLAYYGKCNLAEAQARHAACLGPTLGKWFRYLNWFLAEFSTVITDLPEVIGIGIACHIFFGWPYYVGVILSLLTTMTFLATLSLGMRVLEGTVFLFVAVMSVALFVEMSLVQPPAGEILHGWWRGFESIQSSDIFAITGVVGAVVMPHNLYLHTAACQSRPVAHPRHVPQAVQWSSWEPVVPILVSFAVNLAIVAISAEKVFGEPHAELVGLTDFCNYFSKLPFGCALWAVALLAAGQSSAITTTYTGQYVMDGFLQMNLPLRWRAIITRLIAIAPCIIVSVAFPNQLNQLVNIVNSSLSFLLPFAFTPLVKYNCSPEIMGGSLQHASTGFEKIVLYIFAISVWAINTVALSVQGGGFFGDLRARLMEGNDGDNDNFMAEDDTINGTISSEDDGDRYLMGGLFNYGSSSNATTITYMIILALEVTIQVFYAAWNWYVLFTPITALSQQVPQSEEQANENDEEGLGSEISHFSIDDETEDIVTCGGEDNDNDEDQPVNMANPNEGELA
mmetsp:Transcript_19428/g.41836  ORF Transcript_19428/g.41836 Transcript_19428/m.41836 type:complete len:652 (-) Transcript_19428:506-2461(-)